MTRLKTGWVAILVLFYASFWIWYGGNGDPLTQSEGEAMLRQIEEVHGIKLDDAPDGSISRNLMAMIPNDDGKEFYAVNLETRARTGDAREAEAKYGAIVVPLLLERGGHPVFISERVGLMLGKYGQTIDRVAVVRYRSLRDLIDMILDPAMKDGNTYKSASLEHTEVFITRPTVSFVQMRLLAGLLLLLIGVLGWILIGWSGARKQGGALAQ